MQQQARYFGPTAEVPLANVTPIFKHGDALIRAVARDQTASSADALAFGYGCLLAWLVIWGLEIRTRRTKLPTNPIIYIYQPPPRLWSPVAAADQTKVKAIPLTGGYQAVPVFTIR
jgi:hypothetical protein